MYNHDALHLVLDSLLELERQPDLPPARRAKVGSALEIVYRCLKSKSMDDGDGWHLSTLLIQLIDPPDPE